MLGDHLCIMSSSIAIDVPGLNVHSVDNATARVVSVQLQSHGS